MAKKQKPKAKPAAERSLDEFIAAGKALKDRADKAYIELLAITSELQETRARLEERRARDRDAMQ
jgi:hypothetical protein